MVFKFLICPFKEKNKNEVSSCFFKKNLLILNSVPEATSEFLYSFSSLPLVDFRLCFSVQCTVQGGRARTDFSLAWLEAA
jgi:hypothetical protein